MGPSSFLAWVAIILPHDNDPGSEQLLSSPLPLSLLIFGERSFGRLKHCSIQKASKLMTAKTFHRFLSPC